MLNIFTHITFIHGQGGRPNGTAPQWENLSFNTPDDIFRRLVGLPAAHVWTFSFILGQGGDSPGGDTPQGVGRVRSGRAEVNSKFWQNSAKIFIIFLKIPKIFARAFFGARIIYFLSLLTYNNQIYQTNKNIYQC